MKCIGSGKNQAQNLINNMNEMNGDKEDMTLLGCIVVITAGVLLNSDYNRVLLKKLGIILIIVVTKIFEGECR